VRKITALLLLLLPAAAHAAITGTVVDENGKPVAGATIRVFPTEPSREVRKRMLSGKPEREPISTTTTKDDGAFSADTKGTFAVDVIVDAAGGRRRTMALTDKLDLGPVLLRDASPRTVRVTSGGKPVANALVFFMPNNFTRTDASGTFTQPDSFGGGGATFIHPDHAIEQIPIPATAEVKLQRGIALSGRVVGADGKPVKGATVTINGYPLAQSGEDGSFTIAHAPSNWSSVWAFAGADAGLTARAAAGPIEIRLRRGAVVSGTTRDTVTGQPVPGVIVTLSSTAYREQQSVPADAKGRFTFDPMPAASYNLSGQHWSYSAEGTTVEVSASTSRSVALRPHALVYGRVVDEARKPVAGAIVTAMGAADRRTIADAAGNFLLRVPGEQRQPARAFAVKRGYAAGVSKGMNLKAGEVVRDAVITLPLGFPLQVRVVDRAQRPVAGVRIGLSAREEIMSSPAACDDPARDICTLSDAKGNVGFRVTEGDYFLFARGEQTKIVNVTRQLTLNPKSSPYVLEVESGAAISGRVVMADGSPAPYAEIDVQGGGPGTQFDTTADAAGLFTIDSMPQTRTTLIAATADRRLTSTPVEVTPPAQNVTLTLPRGSRIEGRVTERGTGRPVTDFTVGPMRRSGSFGPPVPPQQFHAEDGTFVLENVPAGNTGITVTASGYVAASRTDLLVEEATPLTGVEVQLDRGARVTGRVTAGGKPLSGVGVTLALQMGSTGTPPRAVTDAEGEYVLEGLSAGERTLDFRKNGYVTKKKTVEVTAAKETRLDMELDRGREIRGRVIDSNGAPVQGANVAARVSSFGGEEARAVSDTDGTFVIEGLSESRYNVTARKRGYVNATERDVDLPVTTPITLTLKTGGTITGRVTGLPERELANVNVNAYGGGPDGSGAFAQTDATGAFTIRGVPDGTVNVSASTNGGERRARPKAVTVSNGSAPPVEIDFAEGFSIRGKVTVNGSLLPAGSLNFFPASGGGPGGSAYARIINGLYEASGLTSGEYRVMVSGTEVRFEDKLQITGSGTYDIEMRGANVRGRVVDSSSGAPVPNAAISLRGKMPAAGRNVRTDSDGRFLIAAVPDDTYKLTAIAETYGQAVLDVTVAGGSAPPEVDVRLEGGKEVVVKIVDATTGKLLSNGFAAISDAKGVALGNNTQRDEEGIRFHLHPGQYTLTASAPGYVTQQKVPFTVPGAEIRVPMQRGGSIAFQTTEPRRVRLMAPGTTKPAWSGTAQTNMPGYSQSLAPGSYVLEVLGKDNSVEKSIPVTIIAGQTVTVPLD
jgi:large repetitive protein